jgi:hypothetical protein
LKIFKTIKRFFSKILGINNQSNQTNSVTTKKYALVFEGIGEEFMTAVKRDSNWNKRAGLEPICIEGSKSDKFYRFMCMKTDDEDVYRTAAVITKKRYGDGKFECEARFNSAEGTWPAIWISTRDSRNNYKDYYELDLSEYYNTSSYTETTYHMPESMRDSSKRIKVVKTDIKPTEWNKFAASWDEEALRVFINDKQVFEFKNNGNGDQFPLLAEQRKLYIILSMQYETAKASSINVDDLPRWMDIRNIKYYKQI